jgi:transcriptional regulator with XRE-family HTH domain
MTSIVEIDELGRRIRKLRLERRMTLKQVEQASSLSATHLSEIERGRTSPTIGALVRIARALEKDASYFIERDERAETAYVTREKAHTLTPAQGVTAEALTPGIPGSRMFPYRLTFAAAASEPELNLKAQQVDGDALYLVRRGRIETQFGDLRVTLGEGDAVQASLTLPHRLRAVQGDSAEVIAVLTRSLEDPS